MRCAEWSPQILPTEDDVDEYPSRKQDWSSMLGLSSSGWKTCEVGVFGDDDLLIWLCGLH